MLYHVQAALKTGVTISTFQTALNPAHSWFRLSNTSWVICTNEGAKVWAQRLMPYTQPDGWVLVSRFDTTEYFGRMSDEFWAWLRLHAQ